MDPLDLPNFLICDAQHLPFKDGAFDESNCTHVLEHLEDPRQAFRELKRVSGAGYIEMPSILYENVLFGYPFHHWCFTKRNGSIYFKEPTKLKVNGSIILPLGWFLHRLTLHKRFSGLVMPVRGLPLFYVSHRWS